MRSLTTRQFRELFATLPTRVKLQARDAYRLFRENPAHPSLRFKQVHSDPPTYSARVGIGDRAVCVVDADAAIWFWIGSHAKYDRLLKGL